MYCSWYNIIGILVKGKLPVLGGSFIFLRTASFGSSRNFRKLPKFLDFQETVKLQRTGQGFMLKFSSSEVNSHKGDNRYFSFIILFKQLSKFQNSNIFKINEKFQIKSEKALDKEGCKGLALQVLEY